jgi:hypothetical protein
VVGAERANRLGKIGVSGILPDTGVVGIVTAGVLDEDQDMEGNDMVHLAMLRPVKCVKPQDCASTAFVYNNVGTAVWALRDAC